MAEPTVANWKEIDNYRKAMEEEIVSLRSRLEMAERGLKLIERNRCCGGIAKEALDKIAKIREGKE